MIIIQCNTKGSEAQTHHQVGQSAHLQLQTENMPGPAKGSQFLDMTKYKHTGIGSIKNTAKKPGH